MAPEYIRDIPSDLTDEQKEIMIRNYQQYKLKQIKSASNDLNQITNNIPNNTSERD